MKFNPNQKKRKFSPNNKQSYLQKYKVNKYAPNLLQILTRELNYGIQN